MQIKAIILYLLALFGTALGGIAVRLTDLGAFNLGFYRLALATIILLPFGVKYRAEYGKYEIIISIILGFFFAFSVVFWNIAVVTTSISSAGLILNLWVFVSILLSAFVFKERVSKYEYVGMFVAIIGLAIMILGQKVNEISTTFGNLMAFGSAVTYALYILAVSKIRKPLNPLGLLFYISIVGTVILFVCSVIAEGIQVPDELHDFLGILIITLIGHIGSLVIINIVLRKLSVVTVSMLSLSQPLMSACLGFFVFGETLSIAEMLGITIVVGAIFVKNIENNI